MWSSSSPVILAAATRRLAGQRAEDGEVVEHVAGGQPDHGDPAAGATRRALVGELQQRFPDRRPAGPELGGEASRSRRVPGASPPVRIRLRSSSAARARTVPPMRLAGTGRLTDDPTMSARPN